jgi:hypothetical protein
LFIQGWWSLLSELRAKRLVSASPVKGISQKESAFTAWRAKYLKGNLKYSLGEKIIGAIASLPSWLRPGLGEASEQMKNEKETSILVFLARCLLRLPKSSLLL